MILQFTVPGPPVPCARPRVVRGGTHTYTPKRTADYKKHVEAIARGALSRLSYWNGTAESYEVRIRVYREARRGDFDNYAKSATDACTAAGVWGDDRHITRAEVEMFVDKRSPRLEVEVEVRE